MRATKWRKLKLPGYAIHDYLRQLQLVFKACQYVVGHWQQGILHCNQCQCQANYEHFKSHHRDLPLPKERVALINKIRNGTLLIESSMDIAAIIVSSN